MSQQFEAVTATNTTPNAKRELLITASIGLYVNRKGHYFLQVITAEEYNNYVFPITKYDATLISNRDNVKIERNDDL